MNNSSNIDNPWKHIDFNVEKNRIVAEEDKDCIENLLKTDKYAKLKEKYKLKLDVYPQHFVGDIENARILILSLNPGYNENYKETYNKNIDYQEEIKNNLQLTSRRFYAFDFPTEKELGYWSNKLKHWIIQEKKRKEPNNNEDITISLAKLANNIALAEFFPYHSSSYNALFDKINNNCYLPTQKFLFDKIKYRINKNDGLTIIIARSFRRWYEAIPELKDYERCYEVSNPSNPSFKPEYIFKVYRTPVQKKVEDLLIEINSNKK